MTSNRVIRRAFKANGNRPLPIGFDIDDLGTFTAVGRWAPQFSSLLGELVCPLPFDCEHWEQIPEPFMAHIFPALQVLIVYYICILIVIDRLDMRAIFKLFVYLNAYIYLQTYFELTPWLNRQDNIKVGQCSYTVGERIRTGIGLQLRLLWRKHRNRIKTAYFDTQPTPETAKQNPPPSTVWGSRSQGEWESLVNWFSDPRRMARSAKNAENRAKNKAKTHQGRKSFVQGRTERVRLIIIF